MEDALYLSKVIGCVLLVWLLPLLYIQWLRKRLDESRKVVDAWARQHGYELLSVRRDGWMLMGDVSFLVYNIRVRRADGSEADGSVDFGQIYRRTIGPDELVVHWAGDS